LPTSVSLFLSLSHLQQGKGKTVESERQGKGADTKFVPDLTLHSAAHAVARHKRKRFPGSALPQPPTYLLINQSIYLSI